LISEGSKQQMTSMPCQNSYGDGWDTLSNLYLRLSTCSVFTYISVTLLNPLFKPYTAVIV